MFKKLLNKVMHSIEQSKSEHGHRRHSTSNRGKREDAKYSRSDRSVRRTAISAVTSGWSRGVLPRTTVMAEKIKGINIIRTNMEAIQAKPY
jgi:hypothetical protein